LDEVTANLDAAHEAEVVSTLKGLAGKGKRTVVVFTHSQPLMRACDNIHMLAEGGVEASGSVAELTKQKLWPLN
jgi:ABC-type transport system involved in cytochrome bd biosynthesis fused ATPase/permease subunit